MLLPALNPHPDSVPDPDDTLDPHPDAGADADFLLFARKGCGEAFARLTGRHVNAVFSTAARVLGGTHGHLAGDVAQEVFVMLAQRAADLPERLNVFAWLHRQTVRMALNTVRSENRRRAREREFVGNQMITMQDGSAETRAALWESVRPHLDQALLELREADRQAILLRHFENRDLRSTGATLGLSAGAAQKRVSRALEALRSRLARRGITAGAAILAVLLTEHSVQAAPALLLPAIRAAASALASPTAAGAFAGGLTRALFTMSKLKASLTGALAGLCAAGAWIVLTPAPAPALAVETAPTARSITSRTLPPGGLMAPDRLRVPGRAHDTAALFQQLRQVAGEFNNELTRQRLRGLMAQVRVEEFSFLYSFISKECTVTEKDLLYPELAKYWGRTRPAEAMEAVMRVNSSPFRRTDGGDLGVIIFREWHERDRRAARQWLTENPEDESLPFGAEEMIGIIAQGFFDDFPKEDVPDAIITWASQMKDGKHRKAAMKALFTGNPEDDSSATGPSAGLRRIFERLAREPDTAFAEQAAQECGAIWSFRDSAALKKALGELRPSEAAWQAALRFMFDPRVAEKADRAELALRLAGDHLPSETVPAILRGATVVTPDLLDWALPRLNGTVRDAVIVETVTRQAGWDIDPGNNREWLALPLALKHSDPAVRDELLRGVFQQALLWRPTQAEAFLATCPWPEDLRTVLREAKVEFEQMRQKP